MTRQRRSERDNSRTSVRRKFAYGKASAESMDKRLQRIETSGRDDFRGNVYPVFTPSEGKNVIRILPPTWDDPNTSTGKADHFVFEVNVHYQVGGQGSKGNYLCLDKMKNEPCPVCEEKDEAYEAGDNDYGKDLRPSFGGLTLIINRKDEEKGPQLWAIPSQSIEQEILLRSKGENIGDVLYVEDVYEGYDITFNRNGTGQKTKYAGVDIARRTSELGTEKQIDEWMDLLEEKPLPSVLVYYDYEHISKVFSAHAVKSESEPTTHKSESSNVVKSKYTYNEIQTMSISEIEDIAYDDLQLLDKDIENLSDTELKDLVCEKLELEEDISKSKEDDSDTRLSKVRERFTNKRSHRDS